MTGKGANCLLDRSLWRTGTTKGCKIGYVGRHLSCYLDLLYVDPDQYYGKRNVSAN
jgi:hypothetical protein